jgi:adenosine deaminase
LAYLAAAQTPLELCPASNICLGVYPSLAAHSLPALMERGLYVTINSDDPPMFNATLTDNFQMCAAEYGWDQGILQRLTHNAVRATLLPEPERVAMARRFEAEFATLDRA